MALTVGSYAEKGSKGGHGGLKTRGKVRRAQESYEISNFYLSVTVWQYLTELVAIRLTSVSKSRNGRPIQQRLVLQSLWSRGC